jgi:hypothetical protein
MRKEFVPREYELILLRHLKRIKPGSKSIRLYHDELSFACVGNITAAIEGNNARSMQNVLVYATKEERRIKELQQEKISRCLHLCEDIATRLHADLKAKVPFVVSKQARTPYKKKRSTVTKCESIDANAKCVENKSIVVQQEDKCVAQFDMGSGTVIDLSTNSSGTTYPSVIVVQNFSLDSEFERTKVNEVLSNDCLKSEHEAFGDVAAHTTQEVLVKETVQIEKHHSSRTEDGEPIAPFVAYILSDQLKEDDNGQCHNHLQAREIIEGKKKMVAADFQNEGAYFVQ